MKSPEETKIRIASLQSRIDKLQAHYEEQMARHHKKRDQTLMQFLLEEQSIYQFAIDQLLWTLD